MTEPKPAVLVTGIAGNLGTRLIPFLADFSLIGVDMYAPKDLSPFTHFEQLDMGTESACIRLVKIFRQYDVRAVVHLAFVIDPLMTGVLDVHRMWQINVAGTARVMEAIAEANRQGAKIERFVFPGSVSAYGPETPPLVDEGHPLAAKALPYALHKQESDEVVRFRAPKLEGCTTYLLRPHIFVGASVNNYLVGALRGTPTGKGRLAKRARAKQKRLPLLMPRGKKYLEKKIQFVHIDDVARLIAFVLRRKREDAQLQILNVAGRGDALTMAQCASIAGAKMLRLPGKTLCAYLLRKMWDIGLSGVPPEAFPYIVGSYTMNTARLQNFLGDEYKDVIRYTIEDALADTFVRTEKLQSAETATAGSVA